MKFNKRLLMALTALVMAIMPMGAALAETSGVPGAERIYGSDVPIITPEDIQNADILTESLSRGNNPPTSNTTLPYTASSNSISSYTYTNYKFKPKSDGKIHTSFSGSATQATTVTLTLYDANTGKAVVTKDNAAKSWDQWGISWYNLDTSHYYYYKISKSSGGTLSFTMKCT